MKYYAPIMNDVAKCENKDCIMKKKCFRHTMIVPGQITWYSTFKPTDNTQENFECEDLIKIDKKGYGKNEN